MWRVMWSCCYSHEAILVSSYSSSDGLSVSHDCTVAMEQLQQTRVHITSVATHNGQTLLPVSSVSSPMAMLRAVIHCSSSDSLSAASG